MRVHTSCIGHPSSCAMGTGGSFIAVSQRVKPMTSFYLVPLHVKLQLLLVRLHDMMLHDEKRHYLYSEEVADIVEVTLNRTFL